MKGVISGVVLLFACVGAAVMAGGAAASPVTSSASLAGRVVFGDFLASGCLSTEPILITAGTATVRSSSSVNPNGRLVAPLQVFYSDAVGVGTETGATYKIRSMFNGSVTSFVPDGQFEYTQVSRLFITSPDHEAPDAGYSMKFLVKVVGESTPSVIIDKVEIENLRLDCS